MLTRFFVLFIFILTFVWNSLFFASGSIISETDDLILEEASGDDSFSTPSINKEEIDHISVINNLRDPFYRLLEQFGFKNNIYSKEKYDLVEFKLKGLIWGVDHPSAIFEGPDKKKYLLKKGDRIGRNNGVIIEIDKGQVQILETFIDNGNKMEKSTIKKVDNAGV